MLCAGDTFLLPKFIGGLDHLWVILLNPEQPSGETVMVNLTTKKFSHQDMTTVLNIGEHPFIKHESIVNYGDANLVKANLIEQSFNMGVGTEVYPVVWTVLRHC